MLVDVKKILDVLSFIVDNECFSWLIQCLGWGKICFSPWTEWIKIVSVPFSNVSVLTTNPDRFKGKVSIPGLIATKKIFSPFQIFISKKVKTDLQPNPCL